MSGVNWTLIQGDARALPLADASIDVIIADPPYENGSHKRKPRTRVGISYASVGYREFEDREWFAEAFRVLKPDGHLYVVIPVREIAPYLALRPDVHNVIAWYQPNAVSMASRWGKSIGGRTFVWRPILHYVGPIGMKCRAASCRATSSRPRSCKATCANRCRGRINSLKSSSTSCSRRIASAASCWTFSAAPARPARRPRRLASHAYRSTLRLERSTSADVARRRCRSFGPPWIR